MLLINIVSVLVGIQTVQALPPPLASVIAAVRTGNPAAYTSSTARTANVVAPVRQPTAQAVQPNAAVRAFRWLRQNPKTELAVFAAAGVPVGLGLNYGVTAAIKKADEKSDTK